MIPDPLTRCLSAKLCKIECRAEGHFLPSHLSTFCRGFVALCIWYYYIVLWKWMTCWNATANLCCIVCSERELDNIEKHQHLALGSRTMAQFSNHFAWEPCFLDRYTPLARRPLQFTVSHCLFRAECLISFSKIKQISNCKSYWAVFFQHPPPQVCRLVSCQII